MNKTVSQTIARIFEIVGYLWLAPSIISLFIPVVYSIMFLFMGHAAGLAVLAVIAGIFGAGVFLLVGYYRHSRDYLGEDKILPLWFGTLLFNLIFLLSAVYTSSSLPERHVDYSDGQQIFLIVFWYLPVCWWAVAVLLSGVAIASELSD